MIYFLCRFGGDCQRFLILLTIFAVACAPATVRKSSIPENSIAALREQIDTILQDSSLYRSRTGIKVISLRTGEVFYEKDSYLLFHPASNMKLLTTATALTKLGPNFRFKTLLCADTSSVVDSLLTGNLYLKGFGNPDLTTHDLWGMVQELKQLGIKSVAGDLICDESYLDDFYFGSGWMWDDASSKYFPPISALTVNRNCVTVKVKPGVAIGDTVGVLVEPPTSYVKIENAGVTVDSSDTTALEAFKVERKWRERENTVMIQGGLSPQSPAREVIVEIMEPALYAGTLFSELLATEKIEFKGRILKDVIPDTNVVLVEQVSAPLATLLTKTNKLGYNNLYAELILKTLGAEQRGVPGTAAKGISVIHTFFNDIGVDTTFFELADGSGVSRYNVVSPQLIIELLQAVHEDFRIQAEFKASLPIAGVDGTLMNRMKGTGAEGKLRAKTGTLRGVSALSGYTTTADGELVAFSMIMEHFVVPTARIRAVQDRIGVLLSSFSRKRPATLTRLKPD